MREILFRGKRIDDPDYYGEWVEGYLFDDGMVNVENYFIGDLVVEQDKYSKDWDITGHCIYRVDPKTICQYTGLKDKNGVKIFDGDIVRKSKHEFAIVAYGEYSDINSNITYHQGFYLKWNQGFFKGYRNDIGYWAMNGIEVIGNVFDAPDLIGGDTDGTDSCNA